MYYNIYWLLFNFLKMPIAIPGSPISQKTLLDAPMVDKTW